MSTETQSFVRQPLGKLRGEAAATSLLEALPVGVIVARTDGTIDYRNATASEFLSDGDDVKSALSDVHVLQPFDGWSTVLSRVVETGAVRQFACAVTVQGKKSPVLATIRFSPFAQSEPKAGRSVIILISENLSHEAAGRQLEVSNRLESLGKLAARVAHELSNPLDGILRYVNLALRISDEPSESKMRSYLSESRTGLMRMVQIIGDLLEYSRTTDGAFDAADINQIVEQAITSHSAAADARSVLIAADYRMREMPFVVGSRLYQVCCNLIKNAIDAMPEGGRLSITTSLTDDHVILEFADTGVGLPDSVDTVFEPFFTTKKAGEGTGLGLAICKDFIEDMQGTIRAAPGEDGGSVFTVRIPVSACRHRPSLLGAGSTTGEGVSRRAE